MATVTDIIRKIGAVNTALKTNLTAKGVTVPDGATSYAMAGLVADISSGTKNETAEVTDYSVYLKAAASVTVTAELGE